ncbi:MAG: addiction module protein [Verrucomicrobiales bacterium]|nr:addiction module protein [Verrucomicrobiales bacterium]
MILEHHPELSRLSPSDKLMLVTELWEDLAAQPDQIPVSDEVIAELDRRMLAHEKNPTAVTTWEEIQLRILGRILPKE